jgi:hypothetical protein
LIIRSTTILAWALGALALSAQTPGGNPLVIEAKQSYTAVKNNLIAMAEKMPAEGYSFKPEPAMRSFGELMAHITDAQMRACSTVNGAAKSVDAASKTSKDDLVTALKASFAECDMAWDATNDSNAQMMITAGRGQRSRLGALLAMTVIHNNEEYGYGSPYLRLKGVVPPSSDRGAARGGK